MAFLLAMIQKREDFLGCDLFDGKLGHSAFPLLGDKSQEHPPRVSVGDHGMWRSAALLGQPLLEEGVQQPR
jgi:hypothetical protein